MLARRMFAKHPWTIEAFQRITTHYTARGILGVLPAGADLPEMLPCPPSGAGSRSTWTAQAHDVSGTVGLLCTSLAEHRACLRTDLTVVAMPSLHFHLVHLPYQHFKPLVDIIAAECHTVFLRGSRSAYKDLRSFDKDIYRAAMAKLTYEQRSLVLSAQNLTMSSASKRLQYFGEGDGRCPFCDSLHSGIVHETWSCPAFKDEQIAEDEYLQAPTPDKVPTHLLLAIPEQIPLEYSDRLFNTLVGTRLDLVAFPSLACDATLPNEAVSYLEGWAGQDEYTATSIAYQLKSIDLPPLLLRTTPIQGLPPTQPNAYSDGSVKHPSTSFAHAAYSVIYPGRLVDDRTDMEKDVSERIDLGPVNSDAGIVVAGRNTRALCIINQS